MKKLKLILFLIIVTASVHLYAQIIDYTEYVNPFIGTGGHGHTYPGAAVPFGMVQLSPDTRLTGWDGCSAYHYSDSIIYGFSHTHLSGTGCSDYGDILLMPFVGTINLKNTECASSFNHKTETASPGYYSVFLDKYQVKVELTATKRAGFHKYTFSENKNAGIIIDLQHRDEVIDSYIEVVNNNEIKGMRRSKAWAADQYVYFVVKFSKPFDSYGIALNDSIKNYIKKGEGKNVKAYFTFKTKKNEVVYAKIGISAVSTDGAYKNLDTEISEWNFEQIKSNAKAEWNKELSKIEVDGGSKEQTTVFYTSLYHAMLNPNIYSDVDGQFRGTDLKIHQAKGFDYYTVFSLWDTYRAEHPLFTIIDQKRTSDFINTFINQYSYGGILPVWELSGNETNCMIGYHAISVIADAFIKGITGFDALKALEAMKYSAELDKYGLACYKKNGFIISDIESESVSRTLEYAYDDWCIAQMALKLGKMNDYLTYIQRAQYYKNLYDSTTGFMRAKFNGAWYNPFEPVEVNSNYTEANAWQYSFYVPQDITGLFNLMGGKQMLSNKLDDLFAANNQLFGREQPDITGLIGQYAHGNEPSHHMTYLYDYVNMPWKTQLLVRKIMDEMYNTKEDGLFGNEDCGQMSAWYVMSAMGFYAVCPGNEEYAIGSPLFKTVTIHLENGNKLIIKANQLSSKNIYIQSATFNGENYNKCFLLHSDIMKGGELIFTMGYKPNKNWGNKDEDVPKTIISEHQIVPVPYFIAKSKTFFTSQKIEIKSIIPDTKIYYTTDGSEPDSTKNIYSNPLEIKESSYIKVVAYQKGFGKSFVVCSEYIKIPEGRSIKLLTSYDSQYTAGGPEGLIDFIRGGKNFRLGAWQGYNGKDFEAIVDLGKMESIHKISAGFLQDIGSWIWMPTLIEYSVSDDNVNFNVVASIKNDISNSDYNSIIKDYTSLCDTKARYIRVKAKGYGIIPSWHLGAGNPSWIFIDEIIVEYVLLTSELLKKLTPKRVFGWKRYLI